MWLHVNLFVGKLGPSKSTLSCYIYRFPVFVKINPNSSPPLLLSSTMSNYVPSPIDATSVSAIRALAADVVAKANSGPGSV